MSYKAIYRQWRPKNFDEMVGQEHITKILINQIQMNQTGHAYLFCGTRGTGKTSAAKILAKGVNCLSTNQKPCGECDNCKSIQDETFMDVIEMDAASNNGVDNIRDLRESIKYPPAKGKYKVYIIDEVHMLSTGAFNALLKTLEEPPSYIKFILATTEVHKLPATILSRCQRFDFRRITEQEMMKRMKYICTHIHIDMEESALMLIAKNADGSVRDALSILDQCLAIGEGTITREEVINVLGTADDEFMLTLTDRIAERDTLNAISLIHEIMTQGKDVQQFMKDWIYHYRNLLMSKITKDLESIVSMSPENIERLKAQGQKLSMPSINNAIMELSKTSAEAKWSSQPKILLEMAIVKLSAPEMNTSLDGLLERITILEETIRTGHQLKSTISDEKASEKPVKKEKGIEYPKVENQDTHFQLKENNKDYQKLWDKIIADARKERPSLTMLNNGIIIKSIDENTFLLHAESESKKEYLNRNKDLIEELFEKHALRRLKLQCVTGFAKSQIKEDNNNDDEIKKELESIFGRENISIVEE